MSGRRHAPYVPRDIDDDALRPALRQAGLRAYPTLIVVSGPSKSGKSRTALEAIAAVLPHAQLIAPKDPAALGKLARAAAPVELGDDPAVIWLDDIEPFVRPGDQGLSGHTLDALKSWRRPVVVLGTVGGKGRALAAADAQRFADPISDLLTAHPPIELASAPSPQEQERMRGKLSPASIQRITADGIGEYMVVAQRLIGKLKDGSCPEGVAVTRAAVDWRRAGLVGPVPMEALKSLFRHYRGSAARRHLRP